MRHTQYRRDARCSSCRYYARGWCTVKARLVIDSHATHDCRAFRERQQNER